MKKLFLYIFLVLLMISACSEQNQISKCKGTDYSKWTNCFGKQKMTKGIYEGQYLNGEFNGQGTFSWADGSKYIGGFKNGKEYGQGTFTFLPSGNKYVGEVKDGKLHGQGTFTWAYGSKYVGEFKDGKKHGQGTWTVEDGTVYKGIWENDKLVVVNEIN
jgi:hypothetical protein